MRVLEIIGLVLLILLIIALPTVVIMLLYVGYAVGGWAGVWLMLIVLWIMIK